MDLTIIFNKALVGDTSILNESGVSIHRNNESRTCLHILAMNVKDDIDKEKLLKHQDIDTVADINGDTPLHILARRGCVDIINHKNVSIIKNKYGDTPLHMLAERGCKQVLEHQDSAIVKNILNKTPTDILSELDKIK